MGIFDGLSDWGSGFLGEVFSPNNVMGAIGLYANSSMQKDAQEKQLSQTQQLAQDKFNQDLQLLNMKHQNDLETLRAKGAGGGGGGGGNAAAMAIANAELALKRKELAQRKALAKFEAQYKGKELESANLSRAAELKQAAMQNLMQGATAPLLRRG